MQGRILQHLIFIIGSSLLFMKNWEARSVLGCWASTCFIVGNIIGMFLYKVKTMKTNTIISIAAVTWFIVDLVASVSIAFYITTNILYVGIILLLPMGLLALFLKTLVTKQIEKNKQV